MLVGNVCIAQTWSTELPNLGTFSSPRAIDLNNDGIKDIVLGSGREEFVKSDSAVIALDGVTGNLLWNVGARDQIFGSAIFQDITEDGTPEVFIGGRSAELMAIDGRTGEILWEYFEQGDSVRSAIHNLYNFYNPQFIPDLDHDGIRDILVANGGDVTAEPYDANRPPGHLMVISTISGREIARASMPDGKETYMSAIVCDLEGDGTHDIIFGTGGETIGGNLFRTTLDEVLKQDLSGSRLIYSSKDKGFIAPPVIVDIDLDGVKDYAVNSVDGRIMAFNGIDNKPFWGFHLEGTEAYGSIGVGHFDQDEYPDLITIFAIGQWPELKWNKVIGVSGGQKRITFNDTLGLYQTSSPVIGDFNQDGSQDALISVNVQNPDPENRDSVALYTTLAMLDFKNHSISPLTEMHRGTNVASTPWIGDLDEDGLLDVVYCYTQNSKNAYNFDGLVINRLTTGIKLDEEIVWGSYTGSEYNGIYQPQGELIRQIQDN